MNIFENKIYQLLMSPLAIIYGTIIWIRNQFYDKQLFRSLKIENCKIISVGNITVGGTGKTPVIKYLAILLTNMGFKVAILSRGYGRKTRGTIIVSNGNQILANVAQAGDEPYLLACELKNIPIVVEIDRYKGALFIQKKFKPQVILLDDGFQHRKLDRDIDIVLIDASTGFGHNFFLPAGLLRESITSLKRADLIWLTRVDQATNFSDLLKQVNRVSTSPIITSNHQPAKLIHANTGKKISFSCMSQKRVLLFSGIANPKSFERTVTNLGAIVVNHLKFPDHHRYQRSDIDHIRNKAKKIRADMIMTTEKDFVRITDSISGSLNIYYLIIEIRISDHFEQLKDQLTCVMSESYEN